MQDSWLCWRIGLEFTVYILIRTYTNALFLAKPGLGVKNIKYNVLIKTFIQK